MIKSIFFTGGHHNSSLEVAKAIRKKGYRILWLGHKHTIRGEKSLSYEFLEVQKSGFDFIELKTGKFYNPSTLIEWLRIPLGFFQAYKLLKKEKAKMVVAFGGYLSSPVVLAAYFLGIPSVCHEQTTSAGLANRLNAVFCRKIFITWPESYKYFPIAKTLCVGLPMRKSTAKNTNLPVFDFSNGLPTILIAGGKQGSHAINLTVGKIYHELLEKYNIIHQTGGLKQTNDYNKLSHKKASLPENLQGRLYIRKYLFQDEMNRALKQANILISRAGAHIVYECLSIGKPVLYIPLRLSLTKEQYKNAIKAKSLGTAEILQEESLRPNTLMLKIEEIFQNLESLVQNGLRVKKTMKKDATSVIVAEIEKLL